MPDPIDAPPPEPTAAPAVPPPKRGVAWLAWAVILLVVGFELLWPRLRPAKTKEGGEEAARRILADVQVRQTVGVAEMFGEGQRATFYAEAKKGLDTGPVADRLRFIVVAGELEAREALAQLRQLEERAAKQGVEPTEEQRATLTALDHLYQAREAGAGAPLGPPLTEEDRALLRHDLGWCGELALAPPDSPDEAARGAVAPARRLARSYLTVMGGGLVLAMLGLVGLVTWFAFFLTGRLRPALPPATRHGGLYAEAFAVYMVTFLGLGVARAFVPVRGPELLLGGLAMLLSLAAGLAWPVLRGLPWRQVRREVGLTLGRHPLLEPVIGIGGYVLILPVFGVGVIVTVILISLQKQWQLGEHPEEHFSPVETPTHPIVEWLERPDWRLLLQVVLLASVLAPLVEETMFRGVLYRHLRDASARLGRGGSFLVSALVVSFVFAVIHPQGALAVPALMALAFGLNLLREWRGSLVPSMIVHGVHNGLTTFMLVQALRT